MAKSSHDRIERIRKPRVHIRIDVETEGGKVQEELPFVVGVLGEFSGDTAPKGALRERDFANIDDTNFDEVMEKLEPTLSFKVDNTLEGGDKQLPIDLKFSEMEDFEPARVAAQVPPLAKLLDTRERLRDLAAQVDRSDELEGLLEEVLKQEDGPDGAPADPASEGGEG